jgi:pimeloyl-ACP methyl ester carboxylesterase
VEPVTWAHFVEQGKGLLDHLGHSKAHILGGCMGVSCAIAFAAKYPDRVSSLLLWWPVGGAKYRIKGQQRFFDHLEFVAREGLEAWSMWWRAKARRSMRSRAAAPGPPSSSATRNSRARTRSWDVDKYKAIVTDMAIALLDRDTSPGAEPEEMFEMDIPALIIPGRDESHATSAARYLEECLPKSQVLGRSVDAQTEDASNKKILEFLTQ